MGNRYGSQSMVAPLRSVLVKRPDKAFAVDDPALWHYTGKPDLAIAQREHDALVAILRRADAMVVFHDEVQPGRADAIFVHDPALVLDAGALVLRMGKKLRRGEEQSIARCFEDLDIPLYYSLSDGACAEGGDLLWLDHDTLAVGMGFRTNRTGLQQLTEALGRVGVGVIPVPLPYYQGVDACLHLMSIISIVDHRIAVVYLPMLPVPFWQELRDRGFQLVEVPDQEFTTMGCNVLAVAPGQCVMLEGNPITRERLERSGCQVTTFRGTEVSLKAEGGPTCLTRPIWRAT